MEQVSSTFVHTLHKSKQAPGFRFASKAVLQLLVVGDGTITAVHPTARGNMHAFSGLGY